MVPGDPLPEIKMTSDLKAMIREIPDFPKPGILFRDITTLLQDKDAFRLVIDRLVERFRDDRLDQLVAIESRGFILASAMAYQLGTGLVPVRKPGKLPHDTLRETYDLEYGTDSLEMHSDALGGGHRVLIVDDLLATGGTAAAALSLVKRAGADVVGCAFLIELSALNGRERLVGLPVFSLVTY
jgi:adenine phosphoribosyltransferase